MDNLVTERLVLHPMSVDEAEAEAEQTVTGEPGADVRWEQGYPTEGDRAVARRFLEHCAATGDPQPFGPYVIRRRSDQRAHGVTSVKGDADHDNTASQHVMTGAGMRQIGEDERVKHYAVSWGR
ncbi:GNAT family N-acetyltransferase [Streptomyces rubiginosohelvolus]